MKKVLLGIVILVVIFLGVNYYLMHATVPDWREKSVLEKISAQYCAWRGGKKLVAGCGIAGCAWRCQIPFSDGGKSCSSDSQCKGACNVVSPKFPTPGLPARLSTPMPAECRPTANRNEYECPGIAITGECESMPLDNCRQSWQYDSGKIKYVWAECGM